jgi:MoxR-like ATPase
MNLKQRITELMEQLSVGIPEREYCIQLAFLTMIIGEPFYIYGRSGSGKALVLDRLIGAFKNAKALKVGRRQQEVPSKFNEYDIIVFQSYDPSNINMKNWVQIALQDRDGIPFIVSGDIRPEVALTRGDIIDKLALTVSLPDSISPQSLCALLTAQNDVTETNIDQSLTISKEEYTQWDDDIQKIVFSQDSLTMIGKLAELCDKNNVYVSVKKWLVLSKIAKASAFFNERTETSLMDTFFLGTNIWGRSITNSVVMEGFKNIAVEILLKDIPEILGERYDTDNLLHRINRNLFTSNNTYDTREFAGETCVSYKITIAGESTPLYVPVRYIETDEDFNPYNELRKVETRVRCNFHGTTNCSIAIDSTVKGVGLRTNAIRGNNNVTFKGGKFEDYASLPTYILKENDPDIIAQKKAEIEEIRKELNETMEKETKNLLRLRDVYRDLKKRRNELFCNQKLFDEILNQIKDIFDTTTGIINKIKEAHALLSSKGV